MFKEQVFVSFVLLSPQCLRPSLVLGGCSGEQTCLATAASLYWVIYVLDKVDLFRAKQKFQATLVELV